MGDLKNHVIKEEGKLSGYWVFYYYIFMPPVFSPSGPGTDVIYITCDHIRIELKIYFKKS